MYSDRGIPPKPPCPNHMRLMSEFGAMFGDSGFSITKERDLDKGQLDREGWSRYVGKLEKREKVILFDQLRVLDRNSNAGVIPDERVRPNFWRQWAYANDASMYDLIGISQEVYGKVVDSSKSRIDALDSNLDREERLRALRKLGIEEKMINYGDAIVFSAVYDDVDELFKRTKRQEPKVSEDGRVKTTIEQPPTITEKLKGIDNLDGRVYREYLWGEYQEKHKGVDEFDKITTAMLRNGELKVIGGLVLPSNGIDENIDLLREAARLVQSWFGRNIIDSKMLISEFQRAAERISMNHNFKYSNPEENRARLSEEFGVSTFEVMQNPGVVLGVGLVLTEKYREQVTKQSMVDGKRVPGQVQSEYRRLSKIWHPDMYTQNPYYNADQVTERFKEIAKAFNVLNDADNFRRWKEM